jgi:formylglycine-generating enzyme required for sulfatase activity
MRRVFRAGASGLRLVGSGLGVALAAGPAVAQSIPLSPVAQAAAARITFEHGIELVTIGAAGNAAWAGTSPPTPGDRAVGRGSVGYEFRIGRYEVTTAQWVEFVNAAMDRPSTDRLPHVSVPARWGAAGAAPVNPGGARFVVPAGNEMRAAGGISWRMAAMYCNWLHNNKSSERAAFLSGAYDVSTFGFTPGGRFLDQLTRSPGARYWIPSWDEWMKAAHFDPNRGGPGQAGGGGWWRYSITSDTAPVYGPPGQQSVIVGSTVFPSTIGPVAQANAGWISLDWPGFNPFVVPLGAYPTVQSPWGLLDVAGATGEWTEEAFYAVPGDPPTDRLFDGTTWASAVFPTSDSVQSLGGGAFPSQNTLDLGFRVAALVPSPSACWVGAGLSWLSMKRRRRRHDKGNQVLGGESGRAGRRMKTGV